MANSNPQISSPAEVLLTSPWVPAEWVKAHSLEPRAILFAPGFAAGAAPLTAGICAFAQNSLRAAEAPTRPAIVFATHCDQLRRAFDTLGPGMGTRTFLFNIPVTTRTSVTRQVFRAELERLGKFLVETGGRPPSAERVAQCMEQYGAARQRLREAASAGTGRDYARVIARFHWDGSLDLPFSAPPPASQAPDATRLAVVGGPLRSDDPLWDQIEAAGGRVVVNGTEWGERSLGFPTPHGETDSPATGETSPLALLSRAFAESCVEIFQRPNQRLYDWLAARLRARRVQGIVLWSYFGCDLWLAEAQTMREKFGLPLLKLEADESGSGTEREANRIQAFVETLK